MGYCCAYGCNSTSSKSDREVSFHRFPKNEDLRRKWIKNISRKDFLPSDVTVLCSKHFDSDSFTVTQSRKRLNPTAIPSLFEGINKPLRKRRKDNKQSPNGIKKRKELIYPIERLEEEKAAKKVRLEHNYCLPDSNALKKLVWYQKAELERLSKKSKKDNTSIWNLKKQVQKLTEVISELSEVLPVEYI